MVCCMITRRVQFGSSLFRTLLCLLRWAALVPRWLLTHLVRVRIYTELLHNFVAVLCDRTLLQLVALPVCVFNLQRPQAAIECYAGINAGRCLTVLALSPCFGILQSNYKCFAHSLRIWRLCKISVGRTSLVLHEKTWYSSTWRAHRTKKRSKASVRRFSIMATHAFNLN